MKDILLIKLGALGDVVRPTCLLRPLERKYPRSRIWWATAKEALPLLRNQPDLYRILPIQKQPPEILRQRRFFLLVNMDEDPSACGWARRIPAQRVIGATTDPSGKLLYTPDSAPYFSLGLLNRDSDGSLRTADALKRKNKKTYQEIWVEILGLDRRNYPRDYEPSLPLPPSEMRFAQRFFSPRDSSRVWVGLNPGAGPRWPSKQISVSKTVELVHALHREGFSPVLFGGPAEKKRNQEILTRARGMVLDARTHHPLLRFAALLSRLRALITTDSLALHLGCAMKVPCVVLFGPTSAVEIELYGRGAKLQPPKPCRCFYQSRCQASRHCLDTLKTSKIAAAVEKLLESPR